MGKILHSSRRKHILVALGVVALLSMVPTFFGSTKSITDTATELSVATPQSTVTPAKRPVVHAVLGDSVVAQLYSLQVVATDKGSVDVATQTYRYTVHVSIRNTGNEELQVSPGLQMSLIDKSGSTHDMTAEYTPAGTTLGGPLAPNATTIVDVDFKLPSDATPAIFVFQQDAGTPATEVKL